jgi:hypothetical protein
MEALGKDLRLVPLKRRALEALLRSSEGSGLELADFQLHATKRILLDLEARTSRATIVCAGTGTGKTLAFYLPALTHVASLMQPNAFWTKAIAIYPRNELLKDQFSETYAEARRLDQLLSTQVGRKLSIGAFFGDTPREPRDLLRNEIWGRHTPGGYVCPYLRCPSCEGALLWAVPDIERGVEQLTCSRHSCGTRITGDEVILTRNRMANTPPDVLFTTTEMLNRQMVNTQYGHVFGLGPGVRRPQIMLLDEVHTYSGVPGAQVAFLLRRWQRALGSKVQFTGLSATLQNAAEFFGQLIGLRPGSVEEISPKESELEEDAEAVEYILALRGDPVAGTSLLSTSIQTAMLLRRILDPWDANPSRGLYGKRVFLFTDDLDVTNRLYNNLQDAEGLDSWNRPKPGEVTLASLRSAAAAEHAERFAAGQSWQLAEDIGHPFGLTQSLRVGRTSSQDTGVDRGSDVVVATAALEVGYNDPDVGAIMQHKAPRDWAAFLQRKGRAGRRRSMRPWTVVVLSDYGRDRIAYQAYDQLFDPELPSRLLPTSNRYVMRMQAVFALMDWLAREMPARLPAGSIWTDFSGPPSGSAPWAEAIRRRQEWERTIIADLLNGSDHPCRSLEAYLQGALQLSREEAEAILWDPPRPLYTAVLPTLLRRLESDWRRIPSQPGESARDYHIHDHPLPDFIPRQLFGDLHLPEVEIVVPAQLRGQDPTTHFLPLVQAMRTFAPGRVTRRFGTEHAYANHWIAPPSLQAPEQDLPVEEFCAEYDEAGTFELRNGAGMKAIRCVRPWAFHPAKVPGNVLPTSNAQLEWKTQIVPQEREDLVHVQPPRGTPWHRIIQDIAFYTHNQRSHVEVRRFAVASRASVRFQQGNNLESRIRFVTKDTGAPAAVGFSQDVDAIVIRFRVPADLGISADNPNRAKIRSFRSAYFRHRVLTDPTLCLFTNSFQREWLVQVYLSALIIRAASVPCSLAEAKAALHRAGLVEQLAQVLDVIFQPLAEADADGENRQRLHELLLELCHTEEVVSALERLAPVLWEPPDEGWHRWARERFKSTLGGALLEACQQSCPQMDVSDLYLDLDAGPRPPGASPLPEGMDEIWISEAMMGGGGVVEEVLRAYASDPRRFFRLADSALAITDFELVDRELTRLLSQLQNDAGLAGSVDAVRRAEGNAALQEAVFKLRNLLSAGGFIVNHLVMSALTARILRPGSSPATDSLLHALISDWKADEERLGVEIDARVFAFLASQRPQYAAGLAAVGTVPHHDPLWRYQAIYGLLWPRGYAARAQSLSYYNPFAEPPPADRELLLDILQESETRVPLEEGWLERVEKALAERGTVSLEARLADRERLKQAILDLGAEALEAGFLHLHPHLAGMELAPGSITLALDLREVLP